METDAANETSNAQSMRVIFLVMALVGGVMALIPAITPFFLAQFLPALIVAICALVFYLWKGAGKGVKMALAIVTLLGGLWLLINVVAGVTSPPMPSLDIAAVLAGDLSGLAALVQLPTILAMGAVGGLVAFLGSIFGIFCARG
jgi:hypothetical protein